MNYVIRMYHDEPIWFCNGVEETYATEEDAIKAIEQESADCEQAVADGFLEDYDFDDYHIIKLGE